MKIFIILLVLLIIMVVLFVGLNYRQLYSAWAIQRETKRLIRQAEDAENEFQNPALAEDHFDGKLSDFWKFTIINGGVSCNIASMFNMIVSLKNQGAQISNRAPRAPSRRPRADSSRGTRQCPEGSEPRQPFSQLQPERR